MALRLLSAERDAVAQHNFFGAIAFCTLLCRRCYKGIWAVTSSFAVPTSSLRTRASLHALTLGSGPPLPHQSPRRFGIRQIELSAVTLTSLPTTCRKWVMSMSSKSPKTNTYRRTLTPTIGNNTSENSR